MPYTTVRVQSVKTEPESTALEIILVAEGPGLPTRPDIVYWRGAPFDALVVRRAARALLDRLNAFLEARAHAQALVGTEVDVTAPLPPEEPLHAPVA